MASLRCGERVSQSCRPEQGGDDDDGDHDDDSDGCCSGDGIVMNGKKNIQLHGAFI